MTAAEFLARLDGVRQTSRGWSAHCPAHDDRSPSLTVKEGDRAILLKCWTGCSAKEIVAAMGLRLSDLFADGPRKPRQRVVLHPALKPFEWRQESSNLIHRAEELELRAVYLRAHTRRLNCLAWSDQDIEVALQAVEQINRDERIAAILRDVAFNVRAMAIEKGWN